MASSDDERTIRQQIIDLLGAEEATLRDISQGVGIPEKEAVDHLTHIERSVRRQGKKLLEIPCRCLSCGFVFEKRRRFTKPGRCPLCRNTHMQPARFHIE